MRLETLTKLNAYLDKQIKQPSISSIVDNAVEEWIVRHDTGGVII